MNTPLFRLYKYYLTYCGSLLNRLHRNTPISKSIFITKFDGLGDFFLLLPVLQYLIKKGFHITLAGPAFQREVLAHCGIPVTCIAFERRSIGTLKTSLDAAEQSRPEFAINLSMNIWGGILVNHTRAPHMIGLIQEPEWYVYKGSKLFYDRTVTYGPSLHNFDVAVRLFDDLSNTGPIEPAFARPVSDGPEIAVHPYASWRPKRWPYFADLVEKLTRAGRNCVIIGTAEEHAKGGLTGGLASNPLCRISTLRSITDLLNEVESCYVFIGNDSGPAHYAGLIGKPTFVLWGPAPFERIRPLGPRVRIFKKEIGCRPCRQRGITCSHGDNECLKSISADEVAAAVLESPGDRR